MASLETELQLELPSAAAAGPAHSRAFSGAEGMRRALHDGRLRGALIFLASLIVAATFENSPKGAIAACAVFSISWILCTHLVERSLRTVTVVAGQFGLAAVAALAGLAVAGGVGFWLRPGTANRMEVISMALLVFFIVLGTEAAKSRLAVLRSRILLVGWESASELVDLLGHNERLPFTAVGIVDDNPELAGSFGGVPVLGSVGELQSIVRETTPDLVVVAVDRGRPEVFAGLSNVAGLGFRVVGLPEFYELRSAAFLSGE